MKVMRCPTERDVSLALLKPIDCSAMKPIKLGKDYRVGYSCSVFKIYWTEGGMSVGRNHDEQFTVVPNTLVVGKLYAQDESDEVYPVEDLSAFSLALKAVESANKLIDSFKDSYHEDSNGICIGKIWRDMRRVYLSDLKGDLTPSAVDSLMQAKQSVVDAMYASVKDRNDKEAARHREYGADWMKHSTLSTSRGRVEGGLIIFEDGEDVVTITLEDGKTVADVFNDKAEVKRWFDMIAPVATSVVIMSLSHNRVDAIATYNDGKGGEARTVKLRNKGEFPMVDHCESKSRRPAYLASKKLFGGCTTGELFDYEHMSGIKAKILEMQTLSVRVERAGGNTMDLAVPLSLVVAGKGSPCLMVAYGSLPAKKVPYVDMKRHLSKGLKVRSLVSGNEFVEMCTSIGHSEEGAYAELRKIWQVESL